MVPDTQTLYRRSEFGGCIRPKMINSDPVEHGSAPLLMRVTSEIVALSFDLDPRKLVGRKRGSSAVSRARQVTAYLLHTTLSMSLIEIARELQKDRTTIGHACRMVEDLRDDPDFDDRISGLESTLHLIKGLADNNLRG